MINTVKMMFEMYSDECKSPRRLGKNRQKSFALKAHQGLELFADYNIRVPARSSEWRVTPRLGEVGLGDYPAPPFFPSQSRLQPKLCRRHAAGCSNNHQRMTERRTGAAEINKTIGSHLSPLKATNAHHAAVPGRPGKGPEGPPHGMRLK